MKFTAEIKMDNAAFESHSGAELARILRRIAEQVESVTPPGGEYGGAYDSNGNRVGVWSIAP